MRPKQVLLRTGGLRPLGKRGAGIQVHVIDGKDGLYAKTNAIRMLLTEVRPYLGPLALIAHIRDKEDLKVILRDYSPWLHRIDLIAIDDVSRRGILTDVRFHALEALMKLFIEDFWYFDADVKSTYGVKKGSRKTIKHGADIMGKLFGHVDIARSQGRVLTSIKESNDGIHQNPEWLPQSLFRAGGAGWLTDMLIQKVGNPYGGLLHLSYETNDDMCVCGILRQRDLVQIYGRMGFRADRESHERLNENTLESGCHVQMITEPSVGISAMQRKFKNGHPAKAKDPDKLVVVGKYAFCMPIINGVKDREGTPTLDFRTHWPEIKHMIYEHPKGIALLEEFHAS